MITFRSGNHEKNYHALIATMSSISNKHKALAYLFSLDPMCLSHIHELYSFEERRPLTTGLQAEWHTANSHKTSLLAFNLYDGYTEGLDSSPYSLFSDCDYTPYYLEAIKLRFPESFWKYELRKK